MAKTINFKNREIHSYLALCGNIALVMVLFTICRILFYLFNLDIFPNITFRQFGIMLWGGLRFDFSAVMVINSIYMILWIITLRLKNRPVVQKILKYWFVVSNGIALMTNCIDIGYFPFTLRRTNLSFFSEFKNEGSLITLVWEMLIDYWYIALIWIAFIFVLSFFYLKAKPVSKPIGTKENLRYYLSSFIALAVTLVIGIFGIRGDFRKNSRPITLYTAGEYVSHSLHIGIVHNTPFCIVKTIGRKPPEKITYFATEAELASVFDPVHYPDTTKMFTPKNVVIIIWESLTREFIGSLNRDLDNGNYTGYTPFIDSLLLHSLTFEYTYANGRKSIDALPSIMASIPSSQESYIFSSFSGNYIRTMGALLKEEGYHTSFFHASHRASMGFSTFMNLHGFDYCYCEEDYPKTPDVRSKWGVWDEEFLQFMALKLNETPEPFCSVVFTLTSHHPFELPERYDGIFKEGSHPLYRCIGYTDYALKRFFETVSQEAWFENTLFVITADHASIPAFPENQNSVGQMSVPIIFYAPGQNLTGTYPYVTQQTDILPSVLSFLHYDKPFVAFGQNALDTTITHIAINYIGNAHHVYYQHYVLMCSENLSILGFYDLKKDPLLQVSVENEHPEIVDMLLRHLKGYLQQYNNRMFENRLTEIYSPSFKE